MAAHDRDIRVNFIPRLLPNWNATADDLKRTRINNLYFRPPKSRATVNRIGKLVVGVEWPLKNKNLGFDLRLISLDELVEPFDVWDNHSGARVSIHPEDLAPLMVALDDAMQSVM